MSASKSPAISLPPEIIESILRRLPAKSLGRFKSASKTWNSLISDPQFIKKHTHNHLHQTPTQLIIYSQTNSLLYSLDTNQLLPYDDEIPATAKELSFRCKTVLGSCNGLVLAKDENDTMFLINPTTHERCEVPLPPLALLDSVDFLVRYGFGYDASTDDYKVVVIFRLNSVDLAFAFVHMYVSVYSLRNNSWRNLPNSFPYGLGLIATLPVVVNQNVHWGEYSTTIVAFSFTTEEFNEFKLQFCEKAKIYGLVDIGGKLGVFLYIGNGYGYELWVMEDYGVSSSWTRVCCLELRGGVKHVCLVEGSDRDIILDVNKGILVFNIDEKRCIKVMIKGGPGGFTFKRLIGTYAESLESPKRILRAP